MYVCVCTIQFCNAVKKNIYIKEINILRLSFKEIHGRKSQEV